MAFADADERPVGKRMEGMGHADKLTPKRRYGLLSQASYKRLEKGKFVWPPIVEGALQLTAGQLALLLEGIDWRRTVAPPQTRRPQIA